MKKLRLQKICMTLFKVISHPGQGLNSKLGLPTPSPMLSIEIIRAVLKYTRGSSCWGHFVFSYILGQ